MKQIETLLERNKWDQEYRVCITDRIMRQRKQDKLLGMYKKRKEIEKFLQKAVHPLIRKRSGE